MEKVQIISGNVVRLVECIRHSSMMVKGKSRHVSVISAQAFHELIGEVREHYLTEPQWIEQVKKQAIAFGMEFTRFNKEVKADNTERRSLTFDNGGNLIVVRYADRDITRTLK